VSKRRNIQAHVQTLRDVRDVLDSMKNLALVEIGKLSHAQEARRHLLAELERVATVCASYFRRLAPPVSRLYLLVGTERAFCGSFNEEIATAWLEVRSRDPAAVAIAIGSVLHEKLTPGPQIVAWLEAPAIAEDLDRSLVAVIERVAAEERLHTEPTGLVAIAHGPEGLRRSAILPFDLPPAPPRVAAPQRNISRKTFVAEFTDRYVDAALHGIFTTSLLGENRARLAHMTGAIDHLDREVEILRRRVHRLRQEEITEEVETILLGTQATRWPTAAAGDSATSGQPWAAWRKD
jgi:F-type H+-transporting ATPase subunit gamma